MLPIFSSPETQSCAAVLSETLNKRLVFIWVAPYCYRRFECRTSELSLIKLQIDCELRLSGFFKNSERGSRLYKDSEKPSWSKNPKYLGDQITLAISQKPVHGHFRASFFVIGIRFFTMLENRWVFQQNLQKRKRNLVFLPND